MVKKMLEKQPPNAPAPIGRCDRKKQKLSFVADHAVKRKSRRTIIAIACKDKLHPRHGQDSGAL